MKFIILEILSATVDVLGDLHSFNVFFKIICKNLF